MLCLSSRFETGKKCNIKFIKDVHFNFSALLRTCFLRRQKVKNALNRDTGDSQMELFDF
jgi:hypothetical protein